MKGNRLRGLTVVLSLAIMVSVCMAGKGKGNDLPMFSPVMPGYTDEDSIKIRISESGPHRVEGIWEFLADGSKIAIEREESEGLSYSIVVVKSSNRLLRPGTLIGKLRPSGKGDVYDAVLYSTDSDGGRLRNPKDYTMTLTDDSSRLTVKRLKSRLTVNLWRLVPYLWRGSIRLRENRGESDDGCVKVFPTPSRPTEPRYL